MRTRVLGFLVISTLTGTTASMNAQAQTWSFEADETGRVPSAWKVEATAQDGPLATWAVQEESSAPDGKKTLTLTKPNHEARGTYNLCWTDSVKFKDGTIAISLKGNSGKIDQGGGPIWRVKDKDNYYICRANPLEDNFRLYYVKDGKRTQIATAEANAATATWHTIKVIHEGNRIECFLDGEKLIETEDDTFGDGGGVGFWTKADAATSFDNVVVERK